MSASAVIPASTFVHRAQDGDLASGLEVAVMAGADDGLVHLEVAHARLPPEATVEGHLHFFEESFYILSGEAIIDIDGHRYHLRANDFGFVPVGAAHAWRNPTDRPVEWFRMRSPQPRAMAGSMGTYPSARVAPPESGEAIGDAHPIVPYVGHFEDRHLPPPGPIAMPGYRGPNIDTVSLWMLVDDLIGALHHTMFMVQFAPGASTHPNGNHFHPFEEAYYFVQGSAIAHLEDGDFEVNTGDLVFAGTNALHGYTMTSDDPTRWIEVQAPTPTASGGFIFPSDWEGLNA